MIKKRAIAVWLPLGMMAAAGLAAPAALAGTITDPSVERTAPNQLTVRWTDVDAVDVLQANRADAPASAATLVSAHSRDGVHEISVTGDKRPYFLLRDSRSGMVTRVAERVLPLQQGSNFRDVGGYATASGKHVRWGMIYRSGGQPMLTDADVQDVKSLGIANLIDLRSDEERVIAPTRLEGIPYSAVGYSMAAILASMAQGVKQGGLATNPATDPAAALAGMANGYRAFPTQLAPQLRIVFRRLLSNEGPILFNCSAGQDRTGFTAAIILSALGVPRDTIAADYLLSTPSRRPQWELPPISDAMAATSPTATFLAAAQKNPAFAKANPLMTTDKTPFISYAFQAIDAKWGSVDHYLEQEVGLSKIDLAALHATYLE